MQDATTRAIARLHYITQSVGGHSHAQLAEQACRGGVRWVQLRVKNAPADEWRRHALETQQVCARHNAMFIINDNVALARDLGADGVHLGKDDMPPADARTMLGADAVIGGTANTAGDILRLVDAGVDYIGLGPYRFTTTKERLSPILGTEGYADVLAQCRQAGVHVPIVAIGGITPADVAGLLHAGVHGVAVSSAINAAYNPARAAGFFLHELSPSDGSL